MYHTNYSGEAKYFCAVAVNCRPSYLNFLRQSRPDEPLKHRNIGEISQQLSHILKFNVEFPPPSPEKEEEEYLAE